VAAWWDHAQGTAFEGVAPDEKSFLPRGKKKRIGPALIQGLGKNGIVQRPRETEKKKTKDVVREKRRKLAETKGGGQKPPPKIACENWHGGRLKNPPSQRLWRKKTLHHHSEATDHRRKGSPHLSSAAGGGKGAVGIPSEVPFVWNFVNKSRKEGGRPCLKMGQGKQSFPKKNSCQSKKRKRVGKRKQRCGPPLGSNVMCPARKG